MQPVLSAAISILEYGYQLATAATKRTGHAQCPAPTRRVNTINGDRPSGRVETAPEKQSACEGQPPRLHAARYASYALSAGAQRCAERRVRPSPAATYMQGSRHELTRTSYEPCARGARRRRIPDRASASRRETSRCLFQALWDAFRLLRSGRKSSRRDAGKLHSRGRYSQQLMAAPLGPAGV